MSEGNVNMGGLGTWPLWLVIVIFGSVSFIFIGALYLLYKRTHRSHLKSLQTTTFVPGTLLGDIESNPVQNTPVSATEYPDMTLLAVIDLKRTQSSKTNKTSWTEQTSNTGNQDYTEYTNTNSLMAKHAARSKPDVRLKQGGPLIEIQRKKSSPAVLDDSVTRSFVSLKQNSMRFNDEENKNSSQLHKQDSLRYATLSREKSFRLQQDDNIPLIHSKSIRSQNPDLSRQKSFKSTYSRKSIIQLNQDSDNDALSTRRSIKSKTRDAVDEISRQQSIKFSGEPENDYKKKSNKRNDKENVDDTRSVRKKSLLTSNDGELSFDSDVPVMFLKIDDDNKPLGLKR